MLRFKKVSLSLLLILMVLLLLLVVFRETLLVSHVNGAIQYFSSDASTYFELYTGIYSDVVLTENPVLFLIGSPILFMKLVDGNLFLVQLANLMLLGFTLKVALECLPTVRAASHFLWGALMFPYFVFGFLSLNKEIYAMCSAIMFGCYLIRGRMLDVFLALTLAMCARYYMFVSMLVLIVMVPHEKPPRYKLILIMLLAISIAAPITKKLVPEYSAEDLLDASGFTGVIFSKAVDSFAYAIIYPIKYLALIPQRAYSFALSSGRETDALEAVVSIVTLWAIVSALRLLPRRRQASQLVRQLVTAGLIAPIPMMWSEIMHWRYYAYVYFFFLFAIVIHEDEKKVKRCNTAYNHSIHKYIVVVSPSYGGAEKRFFDVFTALLRRGEAVSMVAPSSLVDLLRQDHADRPDVLASLISIPMPKWNRLTFIRHFRAMLKELPRGSHFHYPLNCLWPLHLSRGDFVSMSVADCTSVPSPFARKRTSRWAWLSFFFVSRIDVLSPSIYTALRGHHRFQRMSLTPGGTYMVPASQVPGVRKPIVVFFGRLVPGKGLPELFNVLQAIWLQLRDQVPEGFSFQIAGYGELESYVVEQVDALKHSGVPISFIGYGVANELLSRCAVLLSLQEPTNYPSRVVAESLMAGCTVIVRDTGDSRLFGSGLPGLQYCRAVLDAGELAEQIFLSISKLQGQAGFESSVREGATKRFSSTAYIDYFQRLTSGEPNCH